MMVRVFGWDYGFQKVQFTFLLQRELGYSLREAKSRTDAVVNDKVVELQLPDHSDAIVESMRRLGAKVEILVPVGQ